MVFVETKLKGAYIIEPERLEDHRGFFDRTFCREELMAHDLDFPVVQCSVSANRKKGTVRGLHYQISPYQEAKLVRCTNGAVYDVIVDLRLESAPLNQWVATELTAENRRMLFIPESLAHGFQTLQDNTEVFYQMSELYHPECARGVRWSDKAFGISWPLEGITISDSDR